MIKWMLGIVFVQTVVRNWVLHCLSTKINASWYVCVVTLLVVATWMSCIINYNITRLAPAKIALMKKMAVISGAELPVVSGVELSVAAEVPGHWLDSPSATEQLQGFSKSSWAWQTGGGTAVFKESSNRGPCSFYRWQTFQMHAYFNLLTGDEKSCITPIFCNLNGILCNVNLSAVKLQYEDNTWDVKRR